MIIILQLLISHLLCCAVSDRRPVLAVSPPLMNFATRPHHITALYITLKVTAINTSSAKLLRAINTWQHVSG